MLAEQIGSGRLRPGQRLGAERALAAEFGVSRATLRQALAVLEEGGVVRRVPGRGGGTFVAKGKIERDLSRIVGVPALLRSQGVVAGTRVLSARLAEADDVTAQELRARPGELVVDLVRIRLADGSPFSLEHAKFPARRFPGLLELPLGGSVYELIEEHFGARPAEAVERIEVAAASADEAAILDVEPGAPLMAITRTTTDPDGEPIEFSRDLFRADRTRIVVRTEAGASRTEAGASAPSPAGPGSSSCAPRRQDEHPVGRIRFMDQQRVNLDGFAIEDPELGLAALRSPHDPEPSLVVADGRVVELDGVPEAEFDSIDTYIAGHGLDLTVAEEAMALSDVAFARLLVDPAVPRGEDHPAERGRHSGQAGPGAGPAPPARAGHGHDQAARPAHAEQPGPCHQPARRPAAARRRRGHRGGVRLPRDRDHRAGPRRRAEQRGRLPDRRGVRRRRGAHPVLGRGGHGARARHARPDLVRRDRFAVRHRAGVHRR